MPLWKKQARPLKILVARETITLDAKASDTIGDVKAKIQEIWGIPTRHQKLSSGGSELLFDDVTLWQEKFWEFDTIHVATKAKKAMKAMKAVKAMKAKKAMKGMKGKFAKEMSTSLTRRHN